MIDVSFPTKSTRPLRPFLAIYDRMMMPYANASFFWPSGLVSDYIVRSFGPSLPSFTRLALQPACFTPTLIVSPSLGDCATVPAPADLHELVCRLVTPPRKTSIQPLTCSCLPLISCAFVCCATTLRSRLLNTTAGSHLRLS